MKKFFLAFIAALLVSTAAHAGVTSYSDLTVAQEDWLNNVGAPKSISDSLKVNLGSALDDIIGGEYTLAPDADNGATNSLLTATLATPVDTTGTNTYYALNIPVTIGNASGGTNVARAINIPNITGDAQVTETAIAVGSGYDNALTVAGGAVSFASASSVRVQVSTVAALTAAASVQGGLALVTDASGATDCTTGGGSTKNLCVSDGSAWVNVA
jgi:hypothetical protein